MKNVTILILILLNILTSYGQASSFFQESFEGSGIPAGWHTLNYGSGDLDWSFGSGDMPAGDDFSSNAAIFTDDNDNPGDMVILYHDPVDISQHKNIILSFDYAIQAYTIDGEDKGALKVVVQRKESMGGWLTFLTFDSDTNPSSASYVMDNFFADNASSFDLTQIKIGFMWDDEDGDRAWGAGVDTVLFEGVPVNDDCENAIEISSLPYSNSQDMTGTTNNNGFAQSETGLNDGVWYKFTAPYNGNIYMQEVTANFDSEIAVYTGSCNSLTYIESSDHEALDSYDRESIDFEVVAGTTYYINIGYYSDSVDYAETGNLDFSIKYYAKNDEAEYALDIPVSGYGTSCTPPIVVHNNGGATDSSSTNGTPNFSDNGYNGGDVWYKFSAPYTGGVKINISQTADWSSMMHALYESYDSNVIYKLPSNQNYAINQSDNIPSEVIYTGLIPGHVYYLRIWEYNNDNFGDVSFCMAAVVGNDEAVDAIPLIVNEDATQFTVIHYAFNEGATDSSNINGDPGYSFYEGGDVWYKFTAPDNGEVDVTVTQSEWSSFIHYLYESPTSTTSVAHGTNMNVDDSNNLPNTYTYTGLTPGQTYYMRAFDHNNDDFGWVTFYLEKTATQGIEDYESLNFKYYPNPATDIIHINAQENISNVQILNLLGQEVRKISPNSQQTDIDIANLQKGMYILKVNTGEKTTTVKILKQ